MVGRLPRHEHIVGGKAYHGSLAKQQLLEHPMRTNLSDAISGFSMHLNAAGALVQSMTGRHLSTYPEFQAGQAGLEAATTSSTVLAACNAVENFRGSPRGAEMASVLLAKSSRSLPEALRQELEAVRLAAA